MSETSKERVKDAAKKRRDYLQTILRLQLSAGVALSFAVVSALLSAYSLFLVFLLWSRGNPVGISYAFCLAIFLFIALGGWTVRQRNASHAKALPYVPPVREQLAALPAEAILVRGSDEPPTAPEEMLRAAHPGAAAPEQELLRSETRAAE